MEAHITFAETENGEMTDTPLAYVHPASKESVEFVLAQPEKGNDGRSNWVWVRLANGDLILGVYPQGDTYLSVEKDSSYPR